MKNVTCSSLARKILAKDAKKKKVPMWSIKNEGKIITLEK